MRIHVLVLVTILLNSCNPRLIAPPAPTQITPGSETASHPQTPDPQQDRIVSRVIDNLSSLLVLDPKRINVLSVEPVVWPDSSLGCPRSDEVYAKHTVSGYQIWLEANGQEYVYHTDTSNTIILCPEEDLPSFPVTPGEIDDGEPWMPVE